MTIIKPIILFAIGLVFLMKGGDWFVDGAVGIAHKFKLPELLIGATIVSIGTTLPEVLVSAGAAVSGHSEIAYGNAIGSIICNTSLIAAISMAIRPSKVDVKPLKLSSAFFFIAAVFYSAISYTSGRYPRWTGIVLLALFVIYMIISTREALKESKKELKSEGAETTSDTKELPLRRYILLLIIGAAVIAIGADLLVDNGTIIAEYFKVPETVIALTFVALGTSLPELVTAIISLRKGHSSLSVGNIIGANMFNLVTVSGLAITLRPFEVPSGKLFAGHNAALVIDIPLMFVVMIIMVLPALSKGELKRWQGISLLCLYAAYCVFQFCF